MDFSVGEWRQCAVTNQVAFLGNKDMNEEAVILLVEDLENDILLVKKAFERAGLRNPMYVVHDGAEAVSYLSGSGKYANRDEHPLPDLILLDLKMPKMDGFEVLQWLRKRSGIRSIPVVVLTTSDAIRDVNRAYELGANSFLVKPFEFENLEALVKVVREYWMKWVKVPVASRPFPEGNGKEKKTT